MHQFILVNHKLVEKEFRTVNFVMHKVFLSISFNQKNLTIMLMYKHTCITVYEIKVRKTRIGLHALLSLLNYNC